MATQYKPHKWPDVILLIGTDASGKDHIANVLEKMICDEGGLVEKRMRFFSASPTRQKTSTNKNIWDNFQEVVFLNVYRYLGPLLPLLLTGLLFYDLYRYRRADKKLVVVGHNCLRALAFYWAEHLRPDGSLIIPNYLNYAFSKLKEKTGVEVLVLDVSHHIRKKRIMRRVEQGLADRFDLYMLSDPVRSERIEACLVLGAVSLLQANLMMNDDICDDEVKATLDKIFA